MKICIIACENKTDTAAALCAEYCGTLCRHNISAGSTLASVLRECSGLEVADLLNWGEGCVEQVTQLVACGEADMIICLRDPSPSAALMPELSELIRVADFYGVPVATGTAGAEILLHSLSRREAAGFLNRLSQNHRR